MALQTESEHHDHRVRRLKTGVYFEAALFFVGLLALIFFYSGGQTGWYLNISSLNWTALSIPFFLLFALQSLLRPDGSLKGLLFVVPWFLLMAVRPVPPQLKTGMQFKNSQAAVAPEESDGFADAGLTAQKNDDAIVFLDAETEPASSSSYALSSAAQEQPAGGAGRITLLSNSHNDWDLTTSRVYMNPQSYIGNKFEGTGYLMHMGDGNYAFVRYTMICCAADMGALGFEARLDHDVGLGRLGKGEQRWVSVKGHISSTEVYYAGAYEKIPVVVISEVTPENEPRIKYLEPDSVSSL
jgi:uncharacterized membrane protein YcgQ (UPF0703/DUF1980 family)